MNFGINIHNDKERVHDARRGRGRQGMIDLGLGHACASVNF